MCLVLHHVAAAPGLHSHELAFAVSHQIAALLLLVNHYFPQQSILGQVREIRVRRHLVLYLNLVLLPQMLLC